MQRTTKLIRMFKSLKFRLIFSMILMALIPSFIVSSSILASYENRALALRESEVLGQAKIVANQIAGSGYVNKEENSSKENLVSQITMLTKLYDGRVLIVDGSLKIVYDTYNLDENRTIISEEVIRSFAGNKIITSYDSENHYIEMAIPIVNPTDEMKTVLGVFLVSVSTDNIALNASYLRQIATIVEVLVIAAIIFFGVLISVKLVAPFNELSYKIGKLHTGFMGEKIMVSNYTETISICEKFNEMLASMKVTEDSRQEFVSNVSHELKTPLTSMKVLADSINSMPDAPVELYQEFMGDITNEIERETKIINDLLSLVKMDKKAAALNISTVNVNELLEQTLKRIQPIADRQKVQLVLESFRPVTAEVDDVKLTLAISNLVENAVKYNKTDGTGWVRVSLNADHHYFYLKVEDSGMGIPEESLEHIYERFYRVDKSHSREIGGTGLGLAITRTAILMHRGAIKVHSEVGVGTTFDVRIPLNYIV